MGITDLRICRIMNVPSSPDATWSSPPTASTALSIKVKMLRKSALPWIMAAARRTRSARRTPCC